MANYRLKVVVRDMDTYQDVLLNRITRVPGVSGVHTSFVLRRVVEQMVVPVWVLGIGIKISHELHDSGIK